MPTALPLHDRCWRIYFGARSAENRTLPFAVDVDPAENMRIVAEHFEPLMDFAAPGSFDHAGVLPSSALLVDGEVRLYYVGLSLRMDVRTAGFSGLASSADGLAFTRVCAGPVQGLGPFDPYFSVAPMVLATSAGFRMWYVAGTPWQEVDGIQDPFYEIRTTVSADGVVWDPRSEIALPRGPLAAAGLGRPWITNEGNRQRLWFSRRGEAYRVAGADAYRMMSVLGDADGAFSGSAEPLTFENPPGPDDFDSWMQAYGCILPHGDDLVMFYNGNDFGHAGFGWARLPGGALRSGPS